VTGTSMFKPGPIKNGDLVIRGENHDRLMLDCQRKLDLDFVLLTRKAWNTLVERHGLEDFAIKKK